MFIDDNDLSDGSEIKNNDIEIESKKVVEKYEEQSNESGKVVKCEVYEIES